MNKKTNRRLFLRGAAGVALALPLLPSLLEDEAGAAEGDVKRFIALATNHGGVWQDRMYPAEASLIEQLSYHGVQRRRGDLALQVAAGVASLSPVLSADAGVLTPALVQKMNVLRGFDLPFYRAHHRGGHLGNFADNDGHGDDAVAVQSNPMPTIDQLMAWSPLFYPDLATILQRSLVIGRQQMSWGWSNPSNQSGVIQPVNATNDSLALFNQIFVPPSEPGEQRPPIVDLVLEDYKRLRDGNRRLSSEDKRRLNDHLDRLDELERKLNAGVSCGEVTPPTSSSTDELGGDYVINPTSQKRFWQLFNDVIVAAMVCDTSRIASLYVGDHFSPFSGNWHQDIAHQANDVSANSGGGQHPQDVMSEAHQRVFEDVFVDLIAKLDAVDEGGGKTLLDSCLVQWTHESGCITHHPIEMPIITAGGAGGFFNTGSYCDYRNLNKVASQADENGLTTSHAGLILNQWLGNVNVAMGLNPSDFESGGYGGYGAVRQSTQTWYAGHGLYNDGELDYMSEMLPFIVA